MDEVAERLARLCAQAGDGGLRERAGRFGAGAEWDRVCAAVRSGALGPEVAADLDALDDAFARHGVDGLTTGGRGYEPLRGGRSRPVVTVWACPADRACARLEPQEGRWARLRPAPRCGLTGSPLVSRRFTL